MKLVNLKGRHTESHHVYQVARALMGLELERGSAYVTWGLLKRVLVWV